MPRLFLFSALGGLCTGITIGEFCHVSIVAPAVAAGASILLFNWAKTRWLAVAMMFVAVGLWRWDTVTALRPASAAALAGRNVIVSGDILQLPESDRDQSVVLTTLLVDGQIYSGRVNVHLPRWPEVHIGQRLTVHCQPEVFPPNQRWRQWSRGVQSRCFNASLMKTEAMSPSWRLWLAHLEEHSFLFYQQQFSQPQSALVAGIVLGQQNGMPATLTAAFQATGTTHIVALSGFNVTIIVSSVMVLLVRLIGRRWAWIPGLLLVVAFVIMSGSSTSVVRAAIMAIIGQLGLFLGRPLHPSRLLSYTAILMLLHNPLILLHDLGFQLSFLATVGLMGISKPMATRLGWIPDAGGLRENLATTLSAMLLTEPLLLWQFGRLSLIAPLINMLVLPLVPLAMALGTLSFAGLLLPILQPALIALTDGLLRLILAIITVGAAQPWAMVRASVTVSVVASVGCLGAAFWVTYHPHVEEMYPA